MYVLLPYGFTLFSNNHRNDLRPERFYYLMDLHYSQTPCLRRSMCRCFTTLWIYTILKPRGSREFVTLVLLPYGFTLFSNGVSLHYIKYIVLLPYGFTLFSNRLVVLFSVLWFYYLMDLHYSQTSLTELKRICSFTTLWIYTILKPHCWPLAGCTGFTTLWIYTILKHDNPKARKAKVLLPYGFTLFSNQPFADTTIPWFYYLMDLHYSQTNKNISES